MPLEKTKIEELLQKDLLKELGLENLPAGDKLNFLEEMGKVVMQGIWLRILENLSEEDQDEFDAFLATNTDDEAIMAFLTKKIPNLEDLIKEEVANYKALMLSA